VLATILADEKHADMLLTGISDRVNTTAESAVYATAY
jgi:hypothetical protein